MRRVKIEVTARDIEMGRPHRPRSCPIAFGILRVFPVGWVSVGDTITVGNGEWKTPPSMLRFIKRFDAGKPVKPFTFVLPWPKVKR